jgi:membrane dipeptidase
MVTFVPGFVSTTVAEYSKRETERQTAATAESKGDASAVKTIMDAWHTANPAPHATIKDVADHIDHVKAVAGIDHIGLGSDFDGITQTIQGLYDVSKYPNLTAELLRRGYSEADIRKILGENVLRVFQQAEGVSKKLQAERGPSTEIFK